MSGHLLVAIVLALVSAGCATVEPRPLKPEERGLLASTLDPLLRALHGADAARCKLVVATRDEEHLDLRMGRGGDGPCELSLLVTTPTLTQLTSRALQALLAHELAHVQSAHAVGSGRYTDIMGARTPSGQRSVLRVSNQQFTPDEEAEADAIAARLLTVAGRGGNIACLGLADLYEGIARDRSRWGRWLARHPFPERRVARVVAACHAEQRRRPR
jgi:hypothetical protein